MPPQQPKRIVIWHQDLVVAVIDTYRKSPNKPTNLDLYRHIAFAISQNIPLPKKRERALKQAEDNTRSQQDQFALYALQILGGYKLEVTVEDSEQKDSEASRLANDPLLYQLIVDKINEKFNRFLQKFLFDLAELVGRFQTSIATHHTAPHPQLNNTSLKKGMSGFKTQIEQKINALLHELASSIREAIEQFDKTKKGYGKYKKAMARKVAISATSATLGTASTIVSLATGFGSAAAILGLIGTIKSILSLISTIADLAAEAETVERRVFNAIWSYYSLKNQNTNKLPPSGTAPNMKQGKNVAREVGSTFANTLIGEPFKLGYKMVRQEHRTKVGEKIFHSAFTNLKQIEEDCELWKHKLSGIEVKSHKLTMEVNALLSKLNKCEADLITALGGGDKDAGKQKLHMLNRVITESTFSPNQPANSHLHWGKTEARRLVEAEQLESKKNNILRIAALGKMRIKVHQLIEAVIDLQGRVRQGKERQHQAELWVENAKGSTSKHLQRFESVTPSVVSLSMTAGSLGTNLGDLITDGMKGIDNLAKYIYDCCDMALSTATDITSEVHDRAVKIVY